MGLIYQFIKERLMLYIAIASGNSVRSNLDVKVNITVKGSYVLLDGVYNQVTYKVGNEDHTEIVVRLRKNPHNTDRIAEVGLKKSLLDKKYHFVGGTSHGRGYHLLRFAENLN